MKHLNVWILQTGEPLHIDEGSVRPMRAMNLSNALVEAGHKVVLWSSSFYHQEKRHRICSGQIIKVSDNLEIRLIPSRGYKHNIGFDRLRDHAQLALNLRMMLRKVEIYPDVAFIGYPPIEAAAVLSSWLAQRGIPSLLDVKDQWPSIFLNSLTSPLKYLGWMAILPYYYLARRAMRDATGLSAMTCTFLDWALAIAGRARTDSDGVFPLTSPVDRISSSKLDESRRWWNKQGVFDDGRFRVCFVGSHSSAFDFSSVRDAAALAAAEEVPCEFIICGDGSQSRELRLMMSNLPNVRFPGWIDHSKTIALAEICKAMVAPYHNTEDFRMSVPNKIIDSLSLGLPVLSPLQGEVASLIDRYGVGMRYGGDTGTTLYDCIKALSGDESLREGLSNRARATYIDHFSFERVYGGLVNHLEGFVKDHSAKRYILYSSRSDSFNDDQGSLRSGYHLDVWKPTPFSLAPKELASPTFIMWWLFHWARIFKNQKYHVVLIRNRHGKLAHYTVVLPPHFRFPFMQNADLQVGPIGTMIDHRRNHLALHALQHIVREYTDFHCLLWYVVRKENEPSIRLIEKMGFKAAGEGLKVRSRYLRLFSKYIFIGK